MSRQRSAIDGSVPVRCQTVLGRALALCLRVCVLTAGINLSAVAQDPEVLVEVDRQEVYLGESIIYNVTLNHVESPEEPKLDGFDGFRVELLGQQSLNSQQVTIINGRRSEIIRRGMLYQYQLTPESADVTEIPQPSATVDGQSLKGRSVSIRVIAPEKQDVAIVSVTTNRNSVYPLQPFTITLTIAVKQLPGELAERSPLSVQARSPVRLTIPWLDDEQLPDGLDAAQPWKDILQPIISSGRRQGTDGFQINNIASQSGFSLFQSSRKATFLPLSKRTSRKGLDGQQAGYVEYTLQRTLTPQRVGEFRLPPVILKGTFGTELTDDGLVPTDVYVVSDDVLVNVKDVPLDGRPESYIGGVGTFDATSEITPTDARVGDPVTLSIKVTGQGTVADLRPPNINTVAGVAEGFRTYEATEETITNGKIFTYSLRPLNVDTTEFPAVPISFFDVEAEQYVTVQTDAIGLSIGASKQLSATDVVAAAPDPRSSISDSLQANDAGLFANHSSLNELRGVRSGLAHWIGIWCSMVAGYIGLSAGIRRYQRLHADPALMRRRGAAKRSQEALSAIAAAAGSNPSSPDALAKVVTGLIADYTDRAESGMTPDDAIAALKSVGVVDSLTERTKRFLNDCDAARYGAGNTDNANLTQECQSLVEELGRELKQRC